MSHEREGLARVRVEVGVTSLNRKARYTRSQFAIVVHQLLPI
jgi:hypothetical protein